MLFCVCPNRVEPQISLHVHGKSHSLVSQEKVAPFLMNFACLVFFKKKRVFHFLNGQIKPNDLIGYNELTGSIMTIRYEHTQCSRLCLFVSFFWQILQRKKKKSQ